MMGLVKNSHGVFLVRKKVPERLQTAIAQLLDSDKQRVVWLQESLRTKDKREAHVLAKPVLAKFDRLVAKAEAGTAAVPARAELSDQEISRMAAYHFAELLSEDEEARSQGLDLEKGKDAPQFGMSEREFEDHSDNLNWALSGTEDALARGNIGFIEDQLDDLLALFRVRLDRSSAAYAKLGLAVLREHLRALQAIEQRQGGAAVDTPNATVVPTTDAQTPEGETLAAALAGWEKAKKPSPRTGLEFRLGIGRFVQLHGDMPVTQIVRRHIREFREALQEIPVRRAGRLRDAPLPDLVKWSKEHPEAQKISNATVNKSLGAVQAVAVWARDNGLLPEDVPWSDPVANMRLEEAQPEREPWQTDELNVLFSSPVYTERFRPRAGAGEAAYWLPLLGLFTGARLGELGPLRTSDITMDAGTGIGSLSITEDASENKRLKTNSSRRTVPIHPELVRLGFLAYVKKRIDDGGKDVPLFPLLKPGPAGGVAESWSKWFGRYTTSIGITASVFHSFRHSFKDALRASGAGEDINDALTGHSGGNVGRTYGAKDSVRRYGLKRLAEAVAGVRYEGVKL
jgi:integrase